ncbi:PREDICTED: 39S ribosomal protein L19, mitochondrial [Ceratosolen solmsi marchali]|uniref:Large ribosomal subunit protein bL19m n=1 Tax=Ceratosolen solmsi marchali TaxID=326594 RepID=A0AAJ6VMK6_9HYME|nr:PREDICTED: 39S ribosomal protein L19, mitochondrial [Ceratosolen solmsi marchali]
MAITGKIRLNLQFKKPLRYFLHDSRKISTVVSEKINENLKESNNERLDNTKLPLELLDYRFKFAEFLPDPNPLHRNKIREKLERRDMLLRRSNVEIPEFYVGSILAVNYSDQHAPGKQNRFLGICISRTGQGLRASFILRNVIDKMGVEISYFLYDPTIQKIEVIRLEKRLDEELFYLRDAPPEYSTFPLDMRAKIHAHGTCVPINEIKVPLNPLPWLQRWERMNMKGIIDCKSMVNEKRRIKAEYKIHTKPWEKYDLMKMYRETIPIEEQKEIFAEIYSSLQEHEIHRLKSKRTRSLVKPIKTG